MPNRHHVTARQQRGTTLLDQRGTTLLDQRGTTLFEALIALLVLALGIVGVARLQGHLRLTAEVARQRAEAVRWAQAEIESLRGFTTLAAGEGGRSFDAIASASRSIEPATGDASSTRYRLARSVDASGGPGARSVQVSVAWQDRTGAAQAVVLDTLIAAAEPALGGALGLERGGDPVRGPFGRSLRIPFAAKDLGDGSSAFKPVEGGTLAIRFDHRSGRPTARCAAVSPAMPTSALTLASLGPCSALTGQWLSGVIRFSAALPPDAAAANDAPLALGVALLPGATGSAPSASCSADAMKTVSYVGTAGLRIDAVPLAALPASLGLAAWAETGERFVSYHCLVETAPGAAWSGRLAIVPSGWRIGSAAGDRRVCRVASDLDGSGAIDTALEHPAEYGAVSGALANQNYLVIDTTAACPAGRSVRIAGNNASDVYVDPGTLLHAP